MERRIGMKMESKTVLNILIERNRLASGYAPTSENEESKKVYECYFSNTRINKKENSNKN